MRIRGHQARPLACKASPCLLSPGCISGAWPDVLRCGPLLLYLTLLPHTQADAQDFERLLMEEPLLTVRDLSVEFKNDTGETELLRNYEFNISQGIVQRVSRFLDALALIDERGEAPPARGEDDKYATDSARGGVMGFGRKSNVCNQERHPARRVAREQQDVALEAKVAAAAALKVTEQDAKVAALEAEVAVLRAAEQVAKIAALEAEVAKLQALAAPSLQLCALSHPRHTFGTLRTLRALRTLAHPPQCSPPHDSMQSVPSPPLHHLRPPQELAARGWWTEVV
jgi:hypothetical protein